MKLILKNNTEYSVIDDSDEKIIRMNIELSQIDAMNSVFTDENLSSFKYTTDEGELLSQWNNRKLDHLSYNSGVVEFYLSIIDNATIERNKLQEQIDEIAFVILPEILESIEESQTGGEV